MYQQLWFWQQNQRSSITCRRRQDMYKENGRKKPADAKEIANIKGKVYECGACGYAELRQKVEFGEAPRCPRCYKGLLVEKISM